MFDRKPYWHHLVDWVIASRHDLNEFDRRRREALSVMTQEEKDLFKSATLAFSYGFREDLNKLFKPIPAPQKTINYFDFSSIEARISSWLGGEAR